MKLRATPPIRRHLPRNDRATLLAVLTQLLPFIGYPRARNGLNVVNEVAPATTEPTN